MTFLILAVFFVLSILLTWMVVFPPAPKQPVGNLLFAFDANANNGLKQLLTLIGSRKKNQRALEDLAREIWSMTGGWKGLRSLTLQSSSLLEAARQIVEQHPELENEEYDHLCRIIVSLRLSLIAAGVESALTFRSKDPVRFFTMIWSDLFYEIIQRVDHLRDEYAPRAH